MGLDMLSLKKYIVTKGDGSRLSINHVKWFDGKQILILVVLSFALIRSLYL